MKQLIKRFKSFREEHPALGDIIIMSMTIEGMEFSKEVIQRAFNRLVSKDEYDKKDKKEIIESLIDYSNLV